jgi:hypothetical protein
MAQKGGGPCKAKERRSAKNKRTGKYIRQFARTVRRTGRWRGKKFDKISLLPIK